MFRTKSLSKTKAIARFIERIRLSNHDKFCISYLTLDDLEELQLSDTEGIVNYGVDIDGVSVCAFLKESEPDSFKVSMRSNFDVDVCKICNAFGGGGHVKASGCRIDGNLDEVIDKLTNEVSKWME